MDLLFRIETAQSENASHKISSQQDSPLPYLPEENSFRFSPLGGIIGRSNDCDWVLSDPDRKLSGKHAAISFENDQYFITDLSTNGLSLDWCLS